MGDGAGLVAQLPAAAAATALFAAGGYVAAGWASVAACLATAAVATRLPDLRADRDDDEPGYLATLRAGLDEVATRPTVRGAVLAFGLLFGLDAYEEYFPLIARDLQVDTALVPIALLVILLVGAVGAALGGRADGCRQAASPPSSVPGRVLAVAGYVAHPAALAGVALFYGLYRMVLVVVDARLQERIAGPACATVTSVANVVAELLAFAVYAAWALGGAPAVTAFVALAALALPVLLRRRQPVRT